MAQWGKLDQADNSPNYVAAQLNKVANTGNRTALFGNTTADAFVTGKKTGVFGADATEVGVANGSIVSITVINPGSGYTANATVTVAGNGTANASANATGRISAVNISASGNSYTTAPSVTIAAPPAKSFNANTGVGNSTGFITLTTPVFQNGDKVLYSVAAGNTAVTGLTANTYYYVVGANSTGVQLALTVGGAAINVTATAVSETGHTLTGETATAVATISGGKGIAHTGWQLRTEGTGGRAGRVHYETLVAGGITTDASDDTILKDA